MDNSIFADVPSEGTNPFAGETDKQEPTPAESRTETEENGEPTPSQEGADAPAGGEGGKSADSPEVPFNQHPRFKEILNENKSLKEEMAKFNEWKASVEQKLSKPEQAAQPAPMAPWFEKLYGKSPEAEDAWKSYLEWDESRSSGIKESMTAEQQRAAASQQEETTRWNKWVDDTLSEIGEVNKIDFTQDKHLKNEFVNFVLEYRPTDENGNFDLKKGWDLFDKIRATSTNKEASEAKKKAAALSGADKSAPGAKSLSTKDIRRQSWSELARF